MGIRVTFNRGPPPYDKRGCMKTTNDGSFHAWCDTSGCNPDVSFCPCPLCHPIPSATLAPRWPIDCSCGVMCCLAPGSCRNPTLPNNPQACVTTNSNLCGHDNGDGLGNMCNHGQPPCDMCTPDGEFCTLCDVNYCLQDGSSQCLSHGNMREPLRLLANYPVEGLPLRPVHGQLGHVRRPARLHVESFVAREWRRPMFGAASR